MPGRARRVDAVDNRERIVAAARLALAETVGATDDVNLRLIAHTAGVGQGTLYRHFPTREHLIAEAYRDELGELVDLVPVLLEREEPVDALAAWLARVVEYAKVKRGVIAAIEASAWQDLYADQHPRLDHALQALLERGRQAGDIRADVDVPDVFLLLGSLLRIPPVEWDARAHVLVAVIVDGLRSRATDKRIGTGTAKPARRGAQGARKAAG